MALAAYACSLFLLQQFPAYDMPTQILLVRVQFKGVKSHFSIWFLIVPQHNKSVAHAGYKRVYNLAQQANFRTYLLVLCSNRSTALRNGPPFHAGN